MSGTKTNRLLGKIGELLAIYKLLEIGYDNVLHDYGEINDIDLVAIKNKKIDNIQVKTGKYNEKNKGTMFTLVRNSSSKQAVINNKSSFDKLLLITITKDFKASFYLIPKNVIQTIQTFCISKKSKYLKYKI